MRFRHAIVCAAALLVMPPLGAQDNDEPAAPEDAAAAPPAEEQPGRVSLEALVSEVGRSTGREFLLERRTPREVYVAGTLEGVPTYAELLAILRLNGLAAVEIGGLVNVVPTSELRPLATPIVQGDEADVPADAWVTRILTVRADQSASHLVPILRPLMPRDAHLASDGANSLLIVDRYANVQRIAALVEALTE